MPSVQILTPNSNAKTPKYNTHQRIYSKANNILVDSPGLSDDFDLIVGNLLKAFKAGFGKLTGQTKYTGFQVQGFTFTQIDTTKNNGWDVMSGRLHAVALKNGHTMVMLASSSKSKYGMPATIRLKLAKLYLEKAKGHIINWLNGLPK